MRFNRFDLNMLMPLDALLRERNVTRAAEKVFLSQSAMSWTLARLREYYGDPLLIASGRKMILTPFAQSLVEPVRELLLQTQGVIGQRPAVAIRNVERTVRIIGSDHIALTLLGEVFRRAEQEAPGLRLDLRSVTDYSPENFEAGEIDLAILAEGLINLRHPHERLVEDRYVGLIWAENHDIGQTVTSERYVEIDHVATRWRGGRFLTIDQLALRERGVVRRDTIIVPDFTLIPSFVVGTGRLATLPGRLAAILAKQWAVRVVPIDMPLPAIRLDMQWHRHHEDDVVVAWLRQALHAVAAQAATV